MQSHESFSAQSVTNRERKKRLWWTVHVKKDVELIGQKLVTKKKPAEENEHLEW